MRVKPVGFLKLLWPLKSTAAKRGEELRAALEVDDSSPLEPRSFRNHFEHFDERLETWATSSAHRNFVDSNVGSAGRITGVDAADCLRNFDPDTFTVTFRGDTYSLKPVVDALRGLHQKALAAQK